MNETYVTIKGRLVADPTVRTTRAGAPMATFRMASSARRPVAGQPGVWADAQTSFYDVVTYRALAANVGVSVRKGHPVTVHGRQHIVSRPRDDGSTWWGVEVVADAVGHDLAYGTAAFARVSRGQYSDDSRLPAPGARDAFHDVGLGDPERDPYVVEGGPDHGAGRRDQTSFAAEDGATRALGEVEAPELLGPEGGGDQPNDVGEGGETADTGPLLRSSDGDAA